jgi:20S proteasome subunit beta 4
MLLEFIFCFNRVVHRRGGRYHNPEASLEEGLDTLRRCIAEVEKRLIVGLGNFKVKIVDKDGTREIEL